MKAISRFFKRRNNDTTEVLNYDNDINSALVVTKKRDGNIRSLGWKEGDSERTVKLDGNSEESILNKALEVGVSHGRPDVVKKVLQEGATPNATDRNGDPILYDAIRRPSREVVQLLVSNGANVDALVPSEEDKSVRDLMGLYTPIKPQIEGTPLGDIMKHSQIGPKIMSYMEVQRSIADDVLDHPQLGDVVTSFLTNEDVTRRNDEIRNADCEQSGLKHLQTSVSHSSHVSRLEEQMANERQRR